MAKKLKKAKYGRSNDENPGEKKKGSGFQRFAEGVSKIVRRSPEQMKARAEILQARANLAEARRGNPQSSNSSAPQTPSPAPKMESTPNTDIIKRPIRPTAPSPMEPYTKFPTERKKGGAVSKMKPMMKKGSAMKSKSSKKK